MAEQHYMTLKRSKDAELFIKKGRGADELSDRYQISLIVAVHDKEGLTKSIEFNASLHKQGEDPRVMDKSHPHAVQSEPESYGKSTVTMDHMAYPYPDKAKAFLRRLNVENEKLREEYEDTLQTTTPPYVKYANYDGGMHPHNKGEYVNALKASCFTKGLSKTTVARLTEMAGRFYDLTIAANQKLDSLMGDTRLIYDHYFSEVELRSHFDALKELHTVESLNLDPVGKGAGPARGGSPKKPRTDKNENEN